MKGGRDGKHASVGIHLFSCFFDSRNQASWISTQMPCSVSDLSLFLLVFSFSCMFSFFVGEKVSYCYVISSFEKSSNFVSMKIRPTNFCLWKSTRTVLHSKYCFCSKDANQTGNTSSLPVHCLNQYPAINCSNG